MRKLSVILAATFVLLAAPASAIGAREQSAHGRGSISTFQDFSFGARGTLFAADGHITVTFPGTDPNQQIKGQITCLSIVNNQAYMSGPVTRQNPEAAPGPLLSFFAFAEDNGEPGGFRDRFNFFTFAPSQAFNPTCLAPLLGGSLITDGNIDIDPVVP